MEQKIKKIIDEAIKYSYIITGVTFFISCVMALLIGIMSIERETIFASIFIIDSLISVLFFINASILIIIRKIFKI